MGTLYAGLDLWLNQLRIGVPWTLKLRPDHASLRRKEQAKPIDYP
jgi:electron-transferring-flavoprotein dehydrogenase